MFFAFETMDNGKKSLLTQYLHKKYVTFSELYSMAKKTANYGYLRDVMLGAIAVRNPPDVRWGFSSMEDLYEALHNLGLWYDKGSRLIVDLRTPDIKCAENVARLEENIKKLEQTKGYNIVELKKMEALFQSKQDEINGILQELEQCRRDKETLDAEQKNFARIANQGESEIGMLKGELKKLKDDQTEFKYQIDEYETQHAKDAADLDALHADLDECNRALAEIDRQLKEAQKRGDDCIADSELLRAKIKQIEDNLLYVNTQLDTEKARALALEKERDDCAKVLEEAQRDLIGLRNDLKEITEKMIDAQITVDTENKTKNAEIEKMKNALKDTEGKLEAEKKRADSLLQERDKLGGQLDLVKRDIQKLTDEKDQLSAELKKAKGDLENEQGAHKQCRDDVARLEAELEAAKNRNAQLAAEHKVYEETIKNLQTNIATLDEMYAKEQARANNLKRELDNCLSQLAARTGEIDAIKNKLGDVKLETLGNAIELQARADDLTRQLNAIQEQMKGLTDERNKLLTELQNEQKTHIMCKNELEGARGEINQLAADYKTSKEIIKSLQANIATLDEMYAKEQARTNNLKRELDNCLSQLAARTGEIDAIKNKLGDVKLETLGNAIELQARADDLTRQLNAIQEQMKGLTAERDKLQADVQTVKGEHKKCAAELEGARGEIQRLAAELKAKAAQDANMVLNNERSEAVIKQLEENLKELKKQYISEKDRSDKLERERNECLDKLKARVAEKEQIQNNLGIANTATIQKDKEIANLNARIEELNRQLGDIQKNMGGLTAENTRLQAALKEAGGAREVGATELAGARAIIKQLQDELNQSKATIEQLEGRIKQIDAELAAEKARSNALEKDRNEGAKEFKKSQEDLIALNQKLKQISDESIAKYRTKESEIKQLQDKLAAENTRATECQQKLIDCGGKLKEIQTNVQNLTVEKEQLQAALQAEKKAHDKCKDDLNKARAELEAANKRVEQINAELNTERNKINSITKERDDCFKELKEALTDINRLKSGAETSKNEVAAANKRAGELEQKLDERNNQLTKAQERIKTLEGELVTYMTMAATLQVLQEENKTMANLKQLKQDADASIKDLTIKQKQLQQTIEQQTKDSELDKKELARLLAELNKTKDELAAAIKRAKECNDLLQKKEEQITLLSQTKAVAVLEASKLENQNKDLMKARADVEQIRSDLQKQIKELTEKYGASETARQILQQQVEAAQKKIQECEEIKSGIERYKTDLMNDLNGLVVFVNTQLSPQKPIIQVTKEDAQQPMKKAREIANMLWDMIAKIRAELTNCQAGLKTCDEEKKKLSEELKSLKNKLEEAKKNPVLRDRTKAKQFIEANKELNKPYATDDLEAFINEVLKIDKSNIDEKLWEEFANRMRPINQKIQDHNKPELSKQAPLNMYIENIFNRLDKNAETWLQNNNLSFWDELQKAHKALYSLEAPVDYTSFVDRFNEIKNKWAKSNEVLLAKYNNKPSIYGTAIDNFVEKLIFIQSASNLPENTKKQMKEIYTEISKYKQNNIIDRLNTYEYIRSKNLWTLVANIYEDAKGSVRVYIKLNLSPDDLETQKKQWISEHKYDEEDFDVDKFRVANAIDAIESKESEQGYKEVKFLYSCDEFKQPKHNWIWNTKKCNQSMCGPFYDVFDSNDTGGLLGNDIIANKMIPLFVLAKPLPDSTAKGINIVIYGTGYSGSGKTYTLYGNKEMQGVVQYALQYISCKDCAPLDYTKKEESNYEKIYIESIHESYYEPTAKQNAINELIKNMIEKTISIKDIKQVIDKYSEAKKKIGLIKATPNNIESSRSHSCITFRIGERGSRYGKLTVIDMGGSEDQEAILKSYINVTNVDDIHLDYVIDFLRAKEMEKQEKQEKEEEKMNKDMTEYEKKQKEHEKNRKETNIKTNMTNFKKSVIAKDLVGLCIKSTLSSITPDQVHKDIGVIIDSYKFSNLNIDTFKTRFETKRLQEYEKKLKEKQTKITSLKNETAKNASTLALITKLEIDLQKYIDDNSHLNAEYSVRTKIQQKIADLELIKPDLISFAIEILDKFFKLYLPELVREGIFINESICALQGYFSKKMSKEKDEALVNYVNNYANTYQIKSNQDAILNFLKTIYEFDSGIVKTPTTSDSQTVTRSATFAAPTKFVNIVVIRNIATPNNCQGANDAINFALDASAAIKGAGAEPECLKKITIKK